MKLYRTILDFIFPPRCIGCGREGDVFCSSCADDILPHKTSKCKSPEYINDLFFYASYNENPKLRKVILAGKYGSIRDANKVFGKDLADILLKNNLKNVVLVPVPLHWSRRWWRGYNQSEILTQEIAKHAGCKLENVLHRNKNTTPQVKIKSRDARIKNIQNAFRINPKVGVNPEKNYVLVDDVSTTGGTLSACAKVLLEGGAQNISAVVIAHE